MSLSVTETRVDDLAVLGLSGDVDLSTLPRLSDALQRAIANGSREIAVDLDGITVLDDAALGILLGNAARLSSAGGSLSIIVTNPRIRAHLHSTRLDEIVTIHSSIEEARSRQ